MWPTSRMGEIQLMSETWRTGETHTLYLFIFGALAGDDRLPIGVCENMGSRSSMIASFCCGEIHNCVEY